MFGLGYQELLIILVIVLILFGANRLPELARSLGSSVKEFKKGVNEVNKADDRRRLHEGRGKEGLVGLPLSSAESPMQLFLARFPPFARGSRVYSTGFACVSEPTRVPMPWRRGGALPPCTVLSRLPYRARMLHNWDAVQFALALHEYDVVKHQPHPPGYILYVALGRVVHAWIGDAAARLRYLLAVALQRAPGTFVLCLLARAALRPTTALTAADAAGRESAVLVLRHRRI